MWSANLTPALLMLLSTVSVSIHLVSVAKLAREGMPGERILFLTYLTAFIFLLLLLPWSGNLEDSFRIFKEVWIFVGLAFVFQFLSKLFQYSSYAGLDLAEVAGFSAFTPIFTMVLGYFVLGETPSGLAALGVAIVVCSAYVLSFGTKGLRMVNPLKKISSHGASRLAFLSSIPTAFGITLTKRSVALLNPYFFTLVIFFLMTIFCGLSAWIKRRGKNDHYNGTAITPLVIASVTLIASFYLTSCATRGSQASYITGMSRLSIVFQVILGMVILKQRERFVRRLLFSLLLVLGFILIGRG